MNGATYRDSDAPGAWVTLVFLCVLLISAIGLWPLRRLGQWRLTWRCDGTPPASTRQFHTGDLLIWTALIGGVLATIRFMQSMTQENGAGFAEFIFIALSLLLLIALAASAAFARDRGAWHYLILLAGTLLTGGLFVGWNTWEQLQDNSSAVAWQIRLWPTVLDSLKESLPFVCASVVGLANCLALRSLGCYLIRPDSTCAAALPDEYNSS